MPKDKKKRFLVPIEVEVAAASIEEAEAEVIALMNYAFEVSNDEGRFKKHRLHETSDTIQVGS